MFFKCALLVALALNIAEVLPQDCRFYGQSCSDDYSCCGGCCLKGICKDTYLDCRTTAAEDPCIDRYCPGDQVCFTYQPPGCKGCGPLVECRTLPVPKELHNRTHTHYHLINSSNSLGIGLIYLNLCTFIIILVNV